MPEQTKGEIGVTYRELDSILFLHIERSMNEEDIIDWGIDESKVHKVMKLMRNSAHKREPLPRPTIR
jgi:NH3-dependent NAD+ synthetase